MTKIDEVSSAIGELRGDVKGLHVKIDSLNDKLDKHLTQADLQAKDGFNRIESLEKLRDKAFTVIGVLSIFISTVFALAWEMARRKFGG